MPAKGRVRRGARRRKKPLYMRLEEKYKAEVKAHEARKMQLYQARRKRGAGGKAGRSTIEEIRRHAREYDQRRAELDDAARRQAEELKGQWRRQAVQARERYGKPPGGGGHHARQAGRPMGGAAGSHADANDLARALGLHPYPHPHRHGRALGAHRQTNAGSGPPVDGNRTVLMRTQLHQGNSPSRMKAGRGKASPRENRFSPAHPTRSQHRTPTPESVRPGAHSHPHSHPRPHAHVQSLASPPVGISRSAPGHTRASRGAEPRGREMGSDEGGEEHLASLVKRLPDPVEKDKDDGGSTAGRQEPRDRSGVAPGISAMTDSTSSEATEFQRHGARNAGLKIPPLIPITVSEADPGADGPQTQRLDTAEARDTGSISSGPEKPARRQIALPFEPSTTDEHFATFVKIIEGNIRLAVSSRKPTNSTNDGASTGQGQVSSRSPEPHRTPRDHHPHNPTPAEFSPPHIDKDSEANASPECRHGDKVTAGAESKDTKVKAPSLAPTASSPPISPHGDNVEESGGSSSPKGTSEAVSTQ